MVRKRIAAVIFLIMFVALPHPPAVLAQGTPTVQDTPEIQALRERAENGDADASSTSGCECRRQSSDTISA